MYEYLSPDKIRQLAAHDDPDVRHLAEDVRQQAAEILRMRFEEYGERFFQDRNAPQLSQLLWQAVIEGPRQLTEDEVEELERLARMADGWWRPGERAVLELVDLDEWRTYYEGF